jgi:hypothetical protein
LGFLVQQSVDQDEAQSVEEDKKTDWYQLFCQAVAVGVDPRDFGNYTFTQLMALIDGEKLRRYNDMYFNVSGVLSNMTDDNVKEAMQGGSRGNPLRARLLDRMMRPYTPSFLLREIAEARSAKPIPGLSPKVAEGIMQAIERKLVPHLSWLQIKPLWQRIMVTSQSFRS